MENSSKRQLLLCLAAAPSALRSVLDSSIQACRGIFFTQASEPSTMTYCCCCVHSRMMLYVATKDALGALLFLVSRSEPASTDS